MNTEVAPVHVTQDVTGSRIAAALIDIVVLFVVLVVFTILFGESNSTNADGHHSVHIGLNGVPALIYFLLAVAYYLVPEVKTGQTLGKKIMSIRVITLDGSRLSWGKGIIRLVLRIVDVLPFLYLVGFIAVVASEQKQRIGDMAAGTIVVPA